MSADPTINLHYVSSRGTEGPYTFEQTLKLVDHGYIHKGTFVHLNDTENWVAYENSYIFPLIKGALRARKAELNISDGTSLGDDTGTHGTYDDDHSIPTDESSIEQPSGEEKSQLSRRDKADGEKDYRRRKHEKGAAAGRFDIKEADLIWIPNDEDPTERWRQASVEERYDHGETLVVDIETGEEIVMDTDDTHFYCNHEVYEQPGEHTNLMQLEHKNEPAVLHHLKQRFENRHAFTYLGSSILLVVTSYMHRDGIDEPDMLDFVARGNEHLDHLMDVPHPYSIAERAFKVMQYVRSPQVIVSSGECGSGKSYAMNMVMRVLIERSKWLGHMDELEMLDNTKIKIDPTDRDENGKQRKTVTQNDSKAAHALFYDDGDKIPIDERIEAAHEVVDAFGHAMVFNSINSSRFGRFTKLYYQFKDEDIPGKGLPAVADAVPLLCGCRFECLVFEKSRLSSVMQCYNERNFHVFYQMLAARDQEELHELHDYGIADPRHFDMLLGADGKILGNPQQDQEAFLTLWNSMLTVGFADYEIVGMMRILLGILHLGNVVFDEDEEDDEGEEPAVVIHDGNPLEMAASAFDVEVEELFKTVTEARAGKGLNERIVSHSRSEAIYTRNKIMQCMYEGVFRMIFNQVNHAVAPPKKAVEKKVNTLSKEKKKRQGQKDLNGDKIASYDEALTFDLHVSTPGAKEDKTVGKVKSKHIDLASRNDAHKAKMRAAKSKGEGNDEDSDEDEVNKETDLFICMLDFPGFVNEDENDLNDFLINYANEAIQNVYNHNVFDSSFGFFKEGGYEIDIHSVPNSYDCVNLIQSPDYGIITALEEVCNMAMHNQTDDKLLTAMTKKKEIRNNPTFTWGADEHVDDEAVEAKNTHLQQLKMMGHAAQTSKERQNIEYTSMQASWDVGNPFTFVVNHFMGQSRYYLFPPELEEEMDIVGKSWVDINVDMQPESLVPLCLSSALPELRALCLNFTSLLHLSAQQKANLTSAALATASAKYTQEILTHERHKLNDAASEGLIAVSRRDYKACLFRKTITKLVEVMKTLPTYYIRAIIANYKMKPDIFYTHAVEMQLRALCVPHTIDTYIQTESFHFRFDHIITNLFPALESLMHKFLKLKEEVLVSCVLTALGLSPKDYHLSDKMVYLNAKNINQMIMNLQPPAPGSSQHFDLLSGVRNALQKYTHALGMVDSIDSDMANLRTELDHLMEFKEALEKIIAISTEVSVNHDDLPEEKKDYSAESALSEHLTRAAYNLEKSKAELDESVKQMSKISAAADRAHYYARHCWYDLCEKDCSALMPPIRDAKRFVVETSKHIIDNISGFEECKLVQEEAAMISHKCKKTFAHIQTEKRAAQGHEAYKNYKPGKGAKTVKLPPVPKAAEGLGAPPPPSLMPKAAMGTPGAPPGLDDKSAKSDFDNHKLHSRTGVRVNMKDLIEKKKKMNLIAHHLKNDDEEGGGGGGRGTGGAGEQVEGTSRFPSKRKPVKKGADKVAKDAIKKKLIEVGYQIKEKGADKDGKYMSMVDIEVAKAAAVAAAVASSQDKLETEKLAEAEAQMQALKEELRQTKEREEEARTKAEASKQHAWSMAREEEENRRKHQEEERERREELAAKHLSAAEEAEERQRLELEEKEAEHTHMLRMAELEKEEQLAEAERAKEATIQKQREELEAKMKETEAVAAQQLKAVVLETHKHAKEKEELTMRADDEVELDALGEPVEALNEDESNEEMQKHILEADPNLVAFYATHAPNKLHTLPGTVARFKREGLGGTELLQQLHLKYDVNHEEYHPSKQHLKERKKQEKEEKRKEKERKSMAPDGHVFDRGQMVTVFAAQSVYGTDLPARNMMGGLPSAYLKIVHEGRVVHSTRVDNWNNHPMWGRLSLAVEDLGDAGLDKELLWEVVHKPDGADTNGKPHKLVGKVQFSLRTVLENLDSKKEFTATLMTHKHGGEQVPLKGGLLGRHSKIKLISPELSEMKSDGVHAIDENNVTYAVEVDPSDSESSSEESSSNEDDDDDEGGQGRGAGKGGKGTGFPKAMAKPAAVEDGGSDMSSLGGGTPDDVSSAAVSLSGVYEVNDDPISGSAANLMKQSSVEASEEVKVDSPAARKPGSSWRSSSTGILAKGGIRSSLARKETTSPLPRPSSVSPQRQVRGDDESVAGSVTSFMRGPNAAAVNKRNHPLFKRMKEKRQQSVAVTKHRKSRAALKEIYEKVDGKLTPEVLHENYEQEYTEWMTWLGNQTHDITQKNKEIIVARLIYRNVAGPVRLGKVLSDVDAGLITAETDLAHLEGKDQVTPTPHVGEPLLTGETYLEHIVHVDPYDAKEIVSALTRQMLYKLPKTPAKATARTSTTPTKGGTTAASKNGAFNVADYSSMESDAIKWVNWFRDHCPNMRVALYKKYALILMDANIASTSRLKLRMDDDPFLLNKRLGFDRYDMEELKSALENEDVTDKAMKKTRLSTRFSTTGSPLASSSASSSPLVATPPSGRFDPHKAIRASTAGPGISPERDQDRRASLLQLTQRSSVLQSPKARDGVARPRPTILNTSFLDEDDGDDLDLGEIKEGDEEDDSD